MIGATIAHYRITAKLGEGGMGYGCAAAAVALGRRGDKKKVAKGLATMDKRLANRIRRAGAAGELEKTKPGKGRGSSRA